MSEQITKILHRARHADEILQIPGPYYGRTIRDAVSAEFEEPEDPANDDRFEYISALECNQFRLGKQHREQVKHLINTYYFVVECLAPVNLRNTYGPQYSGPW